MIGAEAEWVPSAQMPRAGLCEFAGGQHGTEMNQHRGAVPVANSEHRNDRP
jgi:hypothetical protein